MNDVELIEGKHYYIFDMYYRTLYKVIYMYSDVIEDNVFITDHGIYYKDSDFNIVVFYTKPPKWFKYLSDKGISIFISIFNSKRYSNDFMFKYLFKELSNEYRRKYNLKIIFNDIL